MTSNPISKKNISRKKTCSDCNLISKEVYFSNRFKTNICLECLTERMLNQIRQ